VGACVFCLSSASFSDQQILLRGRTMYLCAPRGQLVEGFLAIAPYECVGALSLLPPESFLELERFANVIESFYREAYGCSSWLSYEQGRGGGGAMADIEAGFPYHAHLCAVPMTVNLHESLAERFLASEISSLRELRSVPRHRPYLYVDCADRHGRRQKVVYLPSTVEMSGELERSRLKPLIAKLAGIPERGHWRGYADDAELAAVTARFSRWQGARETTRATV
jgi:diadenosine tetraphosphate (Ap4A) HIT family hydrolase